MAYITDISPLLASGGHAELVNAQYTLHVPVVEDALSLGVDTVQTAEMIDARMAVDWNRTETNIRLLLSREVAAIRLPDRVQGPRIFKVPHFNVLVARVAFAETYVRPAVVSEAGLVMHEHTVLDWHDTYKAVAIDGLIRAAAGKILARRSKDRQHEPHSGTLKS